MSIHSGERTRAARLHGLSLGSRLEYEAPRNERPNIFHVGADAVGARGREGRRPDTEGFLREVRLSEEREKKKKYYSVSTLLMNRGLNTVTNVEIL